MCVYEMKTVLSIIFHAIYGAVCIQLTHFSYDDSENTCISSYYHHKIRRMTHFSLFKVESWNNCMHCFSYTLGREYRVMRNRYSRLLFASEDRLCANLRVQEQSTNMTSQCMYLAFAWRHRSTVVTSWWSQKRPSLATISKWAIYYYF